MGQGWSQEYAAADAYNTTGNTTSAGLGPRIRADSEPPTSQHYGGTKLNGNIPEDEEVQSGPSNLTQLSPPIAAADWKRASHESGILKEKPTQLLKQAQLAAFLETKAAPASNFSDAPSLDPKEPACPPKPRERAQSYGGLSHFSDYSLFPDKFGAGQVKRRHPSNDLSPDDRSVPATPPSTPNPQTPLQSIKDTFFRTRALSYDPDRDVNVVKSTSSGVVNSTQNLTDQDSLQTMRPRASSYGGGRKYDRHKGVHADRQPFSDYTLFPDKDPKVGIKLPDLKPDKDNVIEDKLQVKETELASKKTQSTFSSVSGQPPTVIITSDNINYVNSAVMIASALTMEANKNRYNDQQKIIRNEERNQNNNNTAPKTAPPRFNFFDFSMIPDKDPRAFVPKNNNKKQNEEIFGKSQN